MARHSLSPGFLKIAYQGASGPHTMTLPVIPVNGIGLPGDQTSWNVVVRNGVPFEVGDAVATLVNVLKPLWNPNVSVQGWELYTVEADEGSTPVFVAAGVIGVNGTAEFNIIPGSQAVFSYKTAAGNNGRLTLLDSAHSDYDTPLTPPNYGNAVWKNVADYLVSEACFIVGRDGEYPVYVPRIVSKINDALRRRRMRAGG